MLYVGPGSGIVNCEMHMEVGAPTPPPPKWRLPTTDEEQEAIRSSLGQLAEVIASLFIHPLSPRNPHMPEMGLSDDYKMSTQDRVIEAYNHARIRGFFDFRIDAVYQSSIVSSITSLQGFLHEVGMSPDSIAEHQPPVESAEMASRRIELGASSCRSPMRSTSF